ncbi:MAG: ChaN family lipoprotein [Desulfobacterales bacterium]|nr:ChaN family lipoprotein [Desulfobacterales bacterium]
MIKKIITAILLVVALNTAGWVKQDSLNHRMFDLNQEKELLMAQALAKLKKNRIILVGEHHSNKQHHQAQLSVIQALNDAGLQVAIGLEMFRNESQPALDQWVSGDIDEKSFEKIYYDNWNFPWSAYRKIFEYSRDHKIPMIGLNVPREITRKVSRNGFKSLSQKQKGKISEVSCIVDQEYMNYIRKAFGGHGHDQLNFIYFCEAQLVWDSAMAVYTLDYLKKNPNSIVVILTGTGHAQKGAVPRQIRARSGLPFAVILPEIPGSIDAETITSKDADYIMLDMD